AFPEAHTTVGTADSALHGWAEWRRGGDEVADPCERSPVPSRSLPVAHPTRSSTPAVQTDACARIPVSRGVGPCGATPPPGLREPAHTRRNPPCRLFTSQWCGGTSSASPCWGASRAVACNTRPGRAHLRRRPTRRPRPHLLFGHPRRRPTR